MRNSLSLVSVLVFSMLLSQFMATSMAASLDPPDAVTNRQDAAEQPAAKQRTQPPIDLKLLETRLKETKAIGLFTKLELKNQVDDLVNQFRDYYQGRLKPATLADLRPPYDLLLLKVLALLRDADPQLATTIVASREDIWAFLANPAKFATI